MVEREAIDKAWDAMVLTRRAQAVVNNGNGFEAVPVDTLPAGAVVEHLIIPGHWGFNDNPPMILAQYRKAA